MAKREAIPMERRSAAFERPKEKPAAIIRRIFQYLYTKKWLLALAVAMSLLSNLLALLGPKLSGYAIDAMKAGAGGVDFSAVFYYTILMIACYLVSAILSYALAALMIKLSRNVVYLMRKDLFNKLVTLPVSFFDRHQTGDVISVLSYDIDTVNASLSNDLVQVLSSVITVGGSFIMMLSLSVELTLIFVAAIPLSILFTRYRSKKVRPLFAARSGRLGAMNGFAEEVMEGLKTVKAYNREEVFIKRFDEKNDAAVQSNFAADHFASKTGPTVNFINNICLALVSVFGALMFMAGHVSLGSISAFVLYSRKFSGPINEFANILSDLQSALAAAERVFWLIDEEPEQADSPGAEELMDVWGDMGFQHVSFSYDEGKQVLYDCDFRAEPGKVVAIVGPTGCGKTTMINLLMRFYDVGEGCITLDGKDIRDVTRESLRKCYTMVLQDTWLFYGTIFDNIAYGKEGVTREEVEAAAKAARIHNYIRSLKKGYDTVLSDNAVNISKGQKQLLTIARAMLLDSPMLILDEATSNVDTQTERRIQSAMLELMKNRTCFVIAHRLSTIQNADMILVVREGRIVERGAHRELMEKKGVYYDMYHSQFEES